MPWWFRFAAASWPPFFSRSCRCRADALLELLDQNLIEISKFLVHIFNLIKISRAIAVRIMDKPGLFGLLLGKIVALVGVTHKFWINTPFGRLDLINPPAALVSDHLNHICFLPGVLNRRCFCWIKQRRSSFSPLWPAPWPKIWKDWGWEIPCWTH